MKKINQYHLENMEMYCPFCKIKMQTGVVQSPRHIFFTSNPCRWIFKIKSEDTLLSSNNFISPTCVAYQCPKCKKVIIDYDKEFVFD